MKTLALTLSASALALTGASVALADDHRGMHKPDADGDGVVTRAEMQTHGAALFARMDADGNGRIEAADRAARQAERFARLDTDGSGEVTRAEMDAHHEARKARMEARRTGPDGQRLDYGVERADRRGERFARLDTDNSGGLSQAELQAGREARGGRRDGKRGQRMGGRRDGGMRMMHGMLRQADADGDRAVTRAEFDAALASHFARIDTDGNGAIGEAERKAAHAAMRERMAERRGRRAE